MEASILDLRYKMKEVQLALKRNELVKITYHGAIGTIHPAQHDQSNQVANHPYFGMTTASTDVDQIMETLRGGRTK